MYIYLSLSLSIDRDRYIDTVSTMAWASAPASVRTQSVRSFAVALEIRHVTVYVYKHICIYIYNII